MTKIITAYRDYTFNLELIHQRERYNLSYTQLAKFLGLSPETIQCYLSGRREVKYKRILQLKQAIKDYKLKPLWRED